MSDLYLDCTKKSPSVLDVTWYVLIPYAINVLFNFSDIPLMYGMPVDRDRFIVNDAVLFFFIGKGFTDVSLLYSLFVFLPD